MSYHILDDYKNILYSSLYHYLVKGWCYVMRSHNLPATSFVSPRQMMEKYTRNNPPKNEHSSSSLLDTMSKKKKNSLFFFLFISLLLCFCFLGLRSFFPGELMRVSLELKGRWFLDNPTRLCKIINLVQWK